MAYHPLTNETGGTAEDRRVEAERILDIMHENGIIASLNDKERYFVEYLDPSRGVSPKQLFWLRDIKDKYL